jgi:hypothetical protein
MFCCAIMYCAVLFCRNFISCDMGGLFEAAGFKCDTKYMCSATKTWSFIKPDTPAAAVREVAAAVADVGAAGAANGNAAGRNLN